VLRRYSGTLSTIHHRIAHRLYHRGVPLLGHILAELAHGRGSSQLFSQVKFPIQISLRRFDRIVGAFGKPALRLLHFPHKQS
jgi:hypothetical protein